MNETPRLRSAFPQTPQTGAGRRLQNGTPAKGSKEGSSLPNAPAAKSSDPDAQPFIPFHVVDAPTQRFYAFFIYGLLMAWRFYDWTTLITEDTESMWNFLKWTGIDAVFLFGLPAFRIPWLEWSTFTTSLLWSLHAVFNVMLMFRIGVRPHGICSLSLPTHVCTDTIEFMACGIGEASIRQGISHQ
jgi:nucleoporin POM152